MACRPILLASLLLPVLAWSQTISEEVLPPPPPVNALQGGWDQQQNMANATQWELANKSAPGSAVAQWNWFQSEYAALNSRNGGVQGPGDKMALNAIANALRTTVPNSMERHLAEYYLAFPSPAAFIELDAAYRVDPDREELISPMLTKALLDGDRQAQAGWSAALMSRGGMAHSLTEAARDVLRCLPPSAVVFTNGDMDTQPLVVQQVLRSDNPGVLVVDRRLLGHLPYRARIWQQAGGAGPVPAAGPGFAQALVQAHQRPVYFALGLDRSWLRVFPGQLNAVGAVFRVGPPSESDAASLEANWKAMAKPLHAGPLSRNYLVPGTLLLEHLRADGLTDKAQRVEAELERIAAATGASKELRQRGILQH